MREFLIDAKQARRFVGSTAQLAGVSRVTLREGVSDGLEAAAVRSGGGWNITVLPGRGMDIGAAEYRGMPVAYVAKPGFVSARHLTHGGAEFFRGFGAGLLTTCGLLNAGPDESVGGERLGVHGRIHELPAFEVSVREDWRRDIPRFTVSGKVRQGRLFGENLLLEREIAVNYGQDRLFISDVVRNEGGEEAPLMILYHMNFGWPILSPDARLYLPESEITPATERAGAGLEAHAQFQQPEPGFFEHVFFHDLRPDGQGMITVALFNPAIDAGIYLKFAKAEFPCFTQWKMMGVGDYVLGLEPGNCYPVGQSAARAQRRLELLAPDEERAFHIEMGMLRDKEELEKILAKSKD